MTDQRALHEHPLKHPRASGYECENPCYQDYTKATEIAYMSYSNQKRWCLLTLTWGEERQAFAPNHRTSLATARMVTRLLWESLAREQRECSSIWEHLKQSLYIKPHVKNKDHVPKSNRHHLTVVGGWGINCRIEFSIVETLPTGSQGCLARQSQGALINSTLMTMCYFSPAWHLPATTKVLPTTTVGCLQNVFLRPFPIV